MQKRFALVMAGGRGTRFWPESTSRKPKQYLSLTGEKPLIAMTLERLTGLVEVEDRYIVTTEDQKELAKIASVGEIAEHGFILEPSGRNTAPCILLSLAQLVTSGATNDDLVAILPSDHVILNRAGFQEVLADAFKMADEAQKMVTIGIRPSFPHTGYGYIERGERVGEGFYKVSSFKEKPDFERAKGYLEAGNYYWNAGMFVAPIGVFLQEFEKHSPATFSSFHALKEAISSPKKLAEVYNSIPKDSIDYAVMEKSQHILVAESRFDWNDLGSWDALDSVINKREGNVVVSEKGVAAINAKDNIVFAQNQFVALINVNDLIVVSNDKVLMVAPKVDAQKVKEMVTLLEKRELNSLI